MTRCCVGVVSSVCRCKGGDVLSTGAALVVGGGGTSLAAAYAMTQLGLKVHNTSPAHPLIGLLCLWMDPT
jgi:shikimate 5-dehydrogenase